MVHPRRERTEGGASAATLVTSIAACRYPNVHLQTCATTLLSLRRALEIVGPEKILYGSDGGFADPKWIDYNLRKIRNWNLTPEIESRILGGTAARLIP